MKLNFYQSDTSILKRPPTPNDLFGEFVMSRWFTLTKVLLVSFILGGWFTGTVVAQEPETSSADSPSGRIAYIGDDYNVYTFDFAQDQTQQLTDDGARTQRYQWPTWSPDGRLAYFCCDLQFARTLATRAYISADGRETGVEVYSGRAQPIIYAYWSPGACAESAGCRDLALLINDIPSRNLLVELIRDDGLTTDRRTVETGSPFYYSWSPDGNEMIFHRNNRTVELFSVKSDRVIDTLGRSSGAYQTPAWSPVDRRVLFGVAGNDAGTTDLVVANGENDITLVESIAGRLSFLWSPDGRYVAYRVLGGDNEGFLTVLDARSGDIVAQSSIGGVFAFFWSPDSQRLAFVTPERSPGQFNVNASGLASPAAQEDDAPVYLTWSILDVQTNLDRQVTRFIPTSEMVYLLLYFDQFAPSHRIWSPDSRSIVYSGFIDPAEPRPVINVLNVTREASQARILTEGVLGIWSFE